MFLVRHFYYKTIGSNIIIHHENISGTASSGSVSVNTVAALQGLGREIIISPATSTTVYSLAIVNADSLTVFISTSITGDFIEEVAIPFRGIYTVSITGATKDELFTMAIIVEE